MQSSVQLRGEDVSVDLGDLLCLRYAEECEDRGPALFWGQVPVTRDDVEVQVREALGLGEQHDVSPFAARNVGQRRGRSAQESTQPLCLVFRQLLKPPQMALWHENEPTW